MQFLNISLYHIYSILMWFFMTNYSLLYFYDIFVKFGSQPYTRKMWNDIMQCR
jgi:hypothetical protein